MNSNGNGNGHDPLVCRYSHACDRTTPFQTAGARALHEYQVHPLYRRFDPDEAARKVAVKERKERRPASVAWSGPTSHSVVELVEHVKARVEKRPRLRKLLDEVGTLAAKQETELRLTKQERDLYRDDLDKLITTFTNLRSNPRPVIERLHS